MRRPNCNTHFDFSSYGSFYALAPSTTLASKPAGHWNTFQIEATGTTITEHGEGARTREPRYCSLDRPDVAAALEALTRAGAKARSCVGE